MLDPDGHMYRKDQPPWLPEDLTNEWLPPVFYLAKLSDEEDEVIRNELETFTDIELGLLKVGCMDEEKDYLFIPWESDDDGLEKEMLKIAQKTGLGNMIFVDRQSSKGHSVILTLVWDKDDNGREILTTEHQRKAGLDCGRTSSRKACLSWINLDVANMGLEELVDGREPAFLSFGMLGEELETTSEDKGYNFRTSTKRAADTLEKKDSGPETKFAKT